MREHRTFAHHRFACAHGRDVTAWPVRTSSFTSGEDRLRRCGAVALNPGSEGATMLALWGASQKAFQQLRPLKRWVQGHA